MALFLDELVLPLSSYANSGAHQSEPLRPGGITQDLQLEEEDREDEGTQEKLQLDGEDREDKGTQAEARWVARHVPKLGRTVSAEHMGMKLDRSDARMKNKTKDKERRERQTGKKSHRGGHEKGDGGGGHHGGGHQKGSARRGQPNMLEKVGGPRKMGYNPDDMTGDMYLQAAWGGDSHMDARNDLAKILEDQREVWTEARDEPDEDEDINAQLATNAHNLQDLDDLLQSGATAVKYQIAEGEVASLATRSHFQYLFERLATPAGLKIRHLDLSSAELELPDIVHLVAALRENGVLKLLRLGGNRLNNYQSHKGSATIGNTAPEVQGARSFASLLKAKPGQSLQHLDLSGGFQTWCDQLISEGQYWCGISGMAQMVCEGGAANQRWGEEGDLHWKLQRNISEVWIEHLAGPISIGAVGIRHLNISYNNLGSSIATWIARMIDGNQTLQFLDISGNNIGRSRQEEKTEEIALALRRNVVLKCLKANACEKSNLKFAGVKQIILAMGENSSLERLELREVPSHESWKARSFDEPLCDADRQIVDKEDHIHGDSRLGKEHWAFTEEHAKALMENTSLTYLDITGVCIGLHSSYQDWRTGPQNLFNVIAANTSLEHLVTTELLDVAGLMWHPQLASHDRLKPVLEAMKSNSTLHTWQRPDGYPVDCLDEQQIRQLNRRLDAEIGRYDGDLDMPPSEASMCTAKELAKMLRRNKPTSAAIIQVPEPDLNGNLCIQVLAACGEELFVHEVCSHELNQPSKEFFGSVLQGLQQQAETWRFVLPGGRVHLPEEHDEQPLGDVLGVES